MINVQIVYNSPQITPTYQSIRKFHDRPSAMETPPMNLCIYVVNHIGRCGRSITANLNGELGDQELPNCDVR